MKFQMRPLATSHARRVTARIADAKGQDLGDKDMYKLVKLVGDSQYGLCADGNAIEGFVVAVDGTGPYDGFALGTVQTNERFIGVADADITIGKGVVAAAQEARGTPLKYEGPKIKLDSGSTSKWRVVAKLGTTSDGKHIFTVEFTG